VVADLVYGPRQVKAVVSGEALGLFQDYREIHLILRIELPLGVGREALVPPDMESEHSSTDADITKVRVAARTSADIPVSSYSLTKAVDTVAFKASQISPPTERSTSAMHNLMEQGTFPVYSPGALF
jgi:hypothetical protein